MSGKTEKTLLPLDQVPIRLLDWYDRHRRVMPWRALPGQNADPYHVWMSEIMLQQTTVAAVKDYFLKFLDRWPTVDALAAAPQEDVLSQWAGLGYYARARNLHKCARVVACDYGGAFPDTEEALLKLPGVGRYTAAAVSAIAFGRRAVVVDGNVERVMARLFDSDAVLPKDKPEFYRLAALCTPQTRPGDYAQAVMDLGATICTPRSPKCTLCPLVDICRGRDNADKLPLKAPKKQKPTRIGAAFWLQRQDGAILLERRPQSGLLGGMAGLPGTDWVDKDQSPPPPVPPVAARNLAPLTGTVRHTFTHFHLELTVYKGQVADVSCPDRHHWVMLDDLEEAGLPTVMKKAAAHAFKTAQTKPNAE